MSRIGESTASRPPADVFQGQIDGERAHHELLRGLDGKQACPFCGSVSERSASACARCGMENTPEARKATKSRIGPWYVLQARNPAAPGMRFETLLSFVRKGRVRARSVVRGPTTHQLWRFAAHVKGLSREFGLCFSCGSAIDPTANICPQCNRLQEPPVNPDVLLENEGDDARAPIYRELPSPPAAQQPAVPVPAAPEPEEADIVIPALGGLEPQEQHEPAKFSESPVAAQVQDTFSAPVPMPSPKPSREPSPLPRVTESNPFTVGGNRRKQAADSSSSFLSAKELAAAFKLSFDPSADMEHADVPDQMPAGALPDGMRPQAIMPRAPMAMSQSSAPREPGRRRRALKKFVLFLLILAGTGFVTMLWVDPTFRERSIQWTNTTWSRIHRYATGADTRPAATKEPAMPDEIPDPPAIVKSSSLDEVDLKRPAVVEVKTPAPAAEQTSEQAAPPAVEPQAPPPVAKSPDPEPAPSARVDASDDEGNSKKVNELWQKAWDSVRAGDYPSAVKAYQEIQKLPRKYWPGDLETKLKLWGGLKKK